jgi:tetratricopeptide (TPR) repeat protein
MKKLLHWIACHTVSLVLLVFLVVAFVFRQPLFGIQTVPGENPVTEKSPVSATLITQFPQSAPKPVEEIQAETASDIQQREQYNFRPSEDLPAEETAAGQVNADLLQKARKAYWNDQLDSAQKLYKAYIDLDPSNPDGYGELGNLLSTLGELDEAAKMYRQAADLLMQQGETEEATQLHKVLDSIRVIQTDNQ